MPRHAFISYSQEDSEEAKKLVDALTKAGLPVWQDVLKARDGNSLPKSIYQGIDQAFCFFTIYSKNSYLSKWVRIELEKAIDRLIPIIPFRIDNQGYTTWWNKHIGQLKYIQNETTVDGEPLDRAVEAAKQFQAEAGKVVSIMNFKGGVGKTTISAQISATIQSLLNNKVLLIDLDPQHNLTQLLFPSRKYDSHTQLGQSAISLFEAGLPHNLPDPTRDWGSISTKSVPNLPALEIVQRLLPSNDDYPGRLDLIIGQFDLAKYALNNDQDNLKVCFNFFRDSLKELRSKYDLIILDTNPSVSFLNLCALEFSHLVISPINADKYATRGLRFLRTIEDKTAQLTRMPQRKVIINEYDKTHSSQVDFVDKLITGRFDDSISGAGNTTNIPESERVLKNMIPSSRYFNSTLEADYSPESKFISHKKSLRLRKLKESLVEVAEELIPLLELQDGRD